MRSAPQLLDYGGVYASQAFRMGDGRLVWFAWAYEVRGWGGGGGGWCVEAVGWVGGSGGSVGAWVRTGMHTPHFRNASSLALPHTPPPPPPQDAVGCGEMCAQGTPLSAAAGWQGLLTFPRALYVDPDTLQLIARPVQVRGGGGRGGGVANTSN